MPGDNENNIDDIYKAQLNKSLSEKFQQDMEKWDKTLNQNLSGKEGEEKLELKQAAMKRMMLLIGSGGLSIAGNSLKEGNVGASKTQGANNNLPVGSYMSGHGGRVYMSFETGQGQQVLNWVTSGNRETDSNIHKQKYFTPDNREANLLSNEIMFDRYSGTHGASVAENGEVTESKGVIYGLRSIIERAINKATFGLLLPPLSPHLGINIPFGGAGEKYKNIDKYITQDGKSGHVYFNINSSPKGDSIGFSLEGTAPRTQGEIGAHSNTGGADKFTAGEGEKYFTKYDPKGKNLISYIKALAEGIKDEKSKEPIDKYLEALEKDENRSFFSKLFNTNSALKDNTIFDKAIKATGLHILKDEKGKPSMITTKLGNQLLEEGLTIPYNYNGQKINFKSNPRKLAEIMEEDINKLPKEIMYFKPQASNEAFMAQAPIFKDIENKPLLKNNPQLSLETCYAFSTLYDLKKSDSLSESAKQSINLVLNIFEKPEHYDFNNKLPMNKEGIHQVINFLNVEKNLDIVKGLHPDFKNANVTDLNTTGSFFNELYDKGSKEYNKYSENSVKLEKEYNIIRESIYKKSLIQGAINSIGKLEEYSDSKQPIKEEVSPSFTEKYRKHIDEAIKIAHAHSKEDIPSNKENEIAKSDGYKTKIEESLTRDNASSSGKLKEYSDLKQPIKEEVAQVKDNSGKSYLDRVREIIRSHSKEGTPGQHRHAADFMKNEEERTRSGSSRRGP